MNPWLTLGVHRMSSAAEIQNAFHDIARERHPDIAGQYKGRTRAKYVASCTEGFLVANEAYQILKDRKKTDAFVKELKIKNKECSTCTGAGYTYKSRGLSGRVYTACIICGGSGFIIKEKRR